MTDFFSIDERLVELDKKALEMCRPVFDGIERIARYNQHKVLAAFINNGVSETHLGISTGYGYGDAGRDKLEQVFAEAAACKGKPTVLLLKTVKGKGVSFMENNAGWHGKAPNDEQWETAKAELEAKIKELEG